MSGGTQPRSRHARVAVLGTLVIWLGFIGLSFLPNGWDSLLIGGVTLVWWYAGFVAPVLIIVLNLFCWADPSTDRPSAGLKHRDQPSIRSV